MKRWTEQDKEWLGYKRKEPAKITLVPPPWEKKSAVDMTTEEFAGELARIRAEALYIKPASGNELKAANRSYRKQKRGKLGY